MNDYRRLMGVAIFSVAALTGGCQNDASLPLGPSVLSPAKSLMPDQPLPDLCIDPPGEAGIVREVLDAVNAERAKRNVRPLRLDPVLNQVADFYACRMIEGAFFGHDDPYDGSTVDTRAADFGYAFRKVGENLAAGHDDVAEVIAHWMKSPGHRDNLLDPAFTDMGVAVKAGGEFTFYWVLELGRPLGTPSDATGSRPTDEPASSETNSRPASTPSSSTAPDSEAVSGEDRP